MSERDEERETEGSNNDIENEIDVNAGPVPFSPVNRIYSKYIARRTMRYQRRKKKVVRRSMVWHKIVAARRKSKKMRGGRNRTINNSYGTTNER